MNKYIKKSERFIWKNNRKHFSVVTKFRYIFIAIKPVLYHFRWPRSVPLQGTMHAIIKFKIFALYWSNLPFPYINRKMYKFLLNITLFYSFHLKLF